MQVKSESGAFARLFAACEPCEWCLKSSQSLIYVVVAWWETVINKSRFVYNISFGTRGPLAK